MTDADLKELVALKSLRVLWLARTNVSDMGLKDLAAVKSLRELSLGGGI